MRNFTKLTSDDFNFVNVLVDTHFVFGDDEAVRHKRQSYRSQNQSRTYIILSSVLFSLLLIVISPIIAAYISYGSIAVLIYRNRKFFLFLLIIFLFLRLFVKKFSEKATVKIILDILIFCAVAYYFLLFLRFNSVEISLAKCMGNKFPYKKILPWSDGYLYRHTKDSKVYETIKFFYALFEKVLGYFIKMFKNIDKSSFVVGFSQLDLFDVSKTLIICLGVLLLSILVIAVLSGTSFVILVIAILIPYIIGAAAVWLTNFICKKSIGFLYRNRN